MIKPVLIKESIAKYQLIEIVSMVKMYIMYICKCINRQNYVYKIVIFTISIVIYQSAKQKTVIIL